MKLVRMPHKPFQPLVKVGEAIHVRGKTIQQYQTDTADSSAIIDVFEHDETDDVWYRLTGDDERSASEMEARAEECRDREETEDIQQFNPMRSGYYGKGEY